MMGGAVIPPQGHDQGIILVMLSDPELHPLEVLPSPSLQIRFLGILRLMEPFLVAPSYLPPSRK